MVRSLPSSLAVPFLFVRVTDGLQPLGASSTLLGFELRVIAIALLIVSMASFFVSIRKAPTKKAEVES